MIYTTIDLLEKSNKLKSKWNRLNVEHTAFLTKCDTAHRYTRQVRQYINEQQMKRERVESRQRTQAKQKTLTLNDSRLSGERKCPSEPSLTIMGETIR